MPGHLWVTEVIGVTVNHRVIGVFCEGVTAVRGIGNVLRFFGGGMNSVNGHNTVILIREESRGVVLVDNG